MDAVVDELVAADGSNQVHVSQVSKFLPERQDVGDEAEGARGHEWSARLPHHLGDLVRASGRHGEGFVTESRDSCLERMDCILALLSGAVIDDDDAVDALGTGLRRVADLGDVAHVGQTLGPDAVRVPDLDDAGAVDALLRRGEGPFPLLDPGRVVAVVGGREGGPMERTGSARYAVVGMRYAIGGGGYEAKLDHGAPCSKVDLRFYSTPTNAL